MKTIPQSLLQACVKALLESQFVVIDGRLEHAITAS